MGHTPWDKLWSGVWAHPPEPQTNPGVAPRPARLYQLHQTLPAEIPSARRGHRPRALCKVHALLCPQSPRPPREGSDQHPAYEGWARTQHRTGTPEGMNDNHLKAPRAPAGFILTPARGNGRLLTSFWQHGSQDTGGFRDSPQVAQPPTGKSAIRI